MNKKVLMKIMLVAIACMSIVLCKNDIFNTGAIEAYAEEKTTSEWKYSVDNNRVTIIEYNGKKTAVEIPSKIDGKSVVGIGEDVFYNRSDIKSVTIPKSVTHIDSFAFAGCSGLTSITIPEGVKSIGSCAFGRCDGLTSVTIPGSVKSIGDDAFSFCSGLTSVIILEGVTNIRDYAFSACSSLTSITIPASVTSIGYNTFFLCDSLKKIVIDKNNKVFDSRNNCNAIIEKSGKRLILGCKSTIIPEGITSIGDSAFQACEGLTSITIPEGVKSIGYDAFSGCSGLTSITIPKSVTSIGGGAFSGCWSLTSITIPEGVTSIECGAFFGCSSLTSITIPEGVKSIGGSAFEGCNGLRSITIPKSVTSIGEEAFRECNGLKKIVVDKCNKVYDSRNNCNAIIEKSRKRLILGCENTIIPESVTSIGSFAFAGCVTSIRIPGSITSIGDYAFVACSGLRSITIPESVTSIGCEAFYNDGNFIIYSSADAYAHTYALENDIKWRDINSKLIEDCLITLGKTECEYDGKEKRPSVIVEIGTKKLVNGKDYTVKYSDNINLGTAKVTITGKGNYKGTVTKTFAIKLPKVTSLTQKSPYSTTSITMSWKAMNGVAGYEVYRADSKTGEYKKVKTTKSTTLKEGKLTRGKTYYYKVRAYKKINGKTVYGVFSSVKAMGTKPQTPSITVVAGNKKAKVVWKKIFGISGYEIYMSESESGTYSKIKTSGSKNSAYLKTGLKSKSTYYFKVRSYRTVGGKKIYSSWSAVKSVKIK